VFFSESDIEAITDEVTYSIDDVFKAKERISQQTKSWFGSHIGWFIVGGATLATLAVLYFWWNHAKKKEMIKSYEKQLKHVNAKNENMSKELAVLDKQLTRYEQAELFRRILEKKQFQGMVIDGLHKLDIGQNNLRGDAKRLGSRFKGNHQELMRYLGDMRNEQRYGTLIGMAMNALKGK
jgi:hypothetical protein